MTIYERMGFVLLYSDIMPSTIYASLCDVIGFPGQFRRFVIPFDERVIQIREINLGHEIRSSNLYFGHSNSHFGQEI